jgi:prolyl oligopeptidase PreP (S9A serine peptidase family)
VLLSHTGTAGLINAPLERALERATVRGELTVVRAVTRTLRRATESDGGRRAYDDLLAAAREVRRTVSNGHPVALIGHSMGAVSAARALLTEPGAFRSVVLRFPVTDLVRFPELGIGRHWTTMLGDPSVPSEQSVLSWLSPCHMPSTGAPIPPVLLQIGRFDSRAHPEHGRRLFERLRREPGAAPDLSEFDVGHIERLGSPQTARAIEETIRFVLSS